LEREIRRQFACVFHDSGAELQRTTYAKTRSQYHENVDGLGMPILGALLGAVSFLCCVFGRSLRRFALAALVAPIESSTAFIAGAFALDDAHAGTSGAWPKSEVTLWLLSVAIAFVLAPGVCIQLQKAALWAARRVFARRAS
jgi:hypothetical protein